MEVIFHLSLENAHQDFINQKMITNIKLSRKIMCAYGYLFDVQTLGSISSIPDTDSF